LLSILIINWNGARYLYGCLDSLRAKISIPFETIVVDNNSSDGSPDVVAERYPWVKLIRSADNLGFAAGNNLAARKATGDVLLLLNYDTLLLADPGPLARAVAEDSTLGCAGAAMCNGAGAVVANCGHFPNPLRLLLFSSIFWNPYRAAASHDGLKLHDVDWVEGSFLLIRRELWERLDGFDEGIFMYGEDNDLCRRIAGLGLRAAHSSALTYRHYVGWSPDRLPYQYAGFRLYHRKHSSWPMRMAVDVILYLGLKLRQLVYGMLAGATGRPRFREKTEALLQVSRNWDRLAEPGFRLQTRSSP